MKKMRQCVWLLETPFIGDDDKELSEIGGGLCIDPAGLIITAAHVVPPTGSYYSARNVDDNDGFRLAKVFGRWDNFDIAVLWVQKDEGETFEYVSLDGAATSLDIDERVFAFVHQGKLAFSSVSKGKVAYPFSHGAPVVDVGDRRMMGGWPRHAPAYESIDNAFARSFPSRRMCHITNPSVRDDFMDFHPHLPLIQLHGFDVRPGSSGCPAFRLSDNSFIGLIAFQKCGFDFVIPMTVLWAIVQSLGEIRRPPDLKFEESDIEGESQQPVADKDEEEAAGGSKRG